jgi:hypothetical protein
MTTGTVGGLVMGAPHNGILVDTQSLQDPNGEEGEKEGGCRCEEENP